MLNNFNVTVTDLKKNLDDFMPKLGPLADSLKTDADNMQNVLTNVDGVAKGADSVLGTADKFITTTDKGLQEQLKQLHVTLLNLKVVTTYAKELVENLAEKPNRIIFSGNRSRPRRNRKFSKARSLCRQQSLDYARARGARALVTF